MRLEELRNYIEGLFTKRNSEHFSEECGITYDSGRNIKVIAYCTNLTLDVVEKAAEKKADLILTHHDAWDFVFGLRDKCIEKMKEYGISHYFIHLPLDDCEFGTNSTLADLIGLKVLEKTHEEDGFNCGVVGEFEKELDTEEVVRRIKEATGEAVMWWDFKEEKVKRAAIVCGAGQRTGDVKKAVDKNCDLYITGEKILYTVEYAEHMGINMIVGSHTFTELPGVRSLAEKIKKGNPEIEIHEIHEKRLESKDIK